MKIMVPRAVHSRPPIRRTVAVACWLVSLAFLAAACGGGAEESPPRPAPAATSGAGGAAIRIAFLGDSLSAGYGLPESESFPARVEAALQAEGRDVRVINAGVSGDTSAGGLARLEWVLRSRPDVVVVELGANDALRGQPLGNIERNLREIVERSRASGARVLLLGMDVPTSYGAGYGGAFADLYPRIAGDLDVALVPGFVREVGLEPGLLQPDGLHPTAEGHRVLAGTLLPHLRRLLDGKA